MWLKDCLLQWCNPPPQPHPSMHTLYVSHTLNYTSPSQTWFVGVVSIFWPMVSIWPVISMSPMIRRQQHKNLYVWVWECWVKEWKGPPCTSRLRRGDVERRNEEESIGSVCHTQLKGLVSGAEDSVITGSASNHQAAQRKKLRSPQHSTYTSSSHSKLLK